jgi:cytochrome c oxidase assembly protein subunit 15
MKSSVIGPAAAESPLRSDWRLQLPEAQRRPMRVWFWSIAAMTLFVLVVGGITRLTQSGLSIVDWNPLMGVVPPLTDAQWQAMFERYQQFPEYRQLRPNMTLAEFRFIFFWEYMHRLLARMIGMVFLVPFIIFAVKRYFNRPLLVRAVLLFALGALQGVMGWFMVMSGLVDRPSVSHFRLAAHLSLAFLIFGFAVWLARDLALTAARATVSPTVRRLMTRGLTVVGVLLGVQIVWGAFVAGLDAGHYYPTFPLMGGRIMPPEVLRTTPALLDFISNPVTVQWLHRIVGTLLGIAVIVFAVRVVRAQADPLSRRLNVVLLALVVTQYLFGVLTLLLHVPVSLGVVHQATALLIFGAWLLWVHHVRNIASAPVP